MTATTDQQGQGGGEKQDAGKGDGKPADIEQLRPMVAEMVETALKPLMDRLGDRPAAGPPAAPAGDGIAGDLAAMVDSAVAKVLGDRDKQSADDDHRKQHEQLAAAAERPPVERPKRSRWLGNIWDKEG